MKLRQSSPPKGTTSSCLCSAFDLSLPPVCGFLFLSPSTWKQLTNGDVQMVINFCIIQHVAKNSQGCRSRPQLRWERFAGHSQEGICPLVPWQQLSHASSRTAAAWRCSTGAQDDLGEVGSGMVGHCSLPQPPSPACRHQLWQKRQNGLK